MAGRSSDRRRQVWLRPTQDERPGDLGPPRHMEGRLRPSALASAGPSTPSQGLRQVLGPGDWVRRESRRLWAGSALDVVGVQYVTPGGYRRDTEVVETRAVEVVCLVVDHIDRVALALAYGAATGTRGWSLPSVWVGNGEDQLNAAERAIREVIGWSVHTARPLWSLPRWPERSDLVTTVVTGRARQAERRAGADVEAVEWYSRQELLGMLRAGHALDAATVAVLYWWLLEGLRR